MTIYITRSTTHSNTINLFYHLHKKQESMRVLKMSPCYRVVEYIIQNVGRNKVFHVCSILNLQNMRCILIWI